MHKLKKKKKTQRKEKQKEEQTKQIGQANLIVVYQCVIVVYLKYKSTNPNLFPPL